jgi:hypothetical protein
VTGVDAKKLVLGFIAMLLTFILIGLISAIYGNFFGYARLKELGDFQTGTNVFFWIMSGSSIEALLRASVLLNPFGGDWLHLAMSALFYIVLLWIWMYYGGVIARLTALQYAKDDIPTLTEAARMVQKRRKSFYFAALTPLLGVFIFAAGNILVGLLGSIPSVGPWFTAVLVPLCCIPATIIITFTAVTGILGFGLIAPAMSIGGKDSFEGWSSAYGYVLWGFNRWVAYTALAALIGMLTTIAAWVAGELFTFIMRTTVELGLALFSNKSLVYCAPFISDESANFVQAFLHKVTPCVAPVSAPGSGFEATGATISSAVAASIAMFVRVLVFGYAFSYFFTANTIKCFLLRKHVDRIEIEEVYEEKAEEAGAAPEASQTASEAQASQQAEQGGQKPDEPKQ